MKIYYILFTFFFVSNNRLCIGWQASSQNPGLKVRISQTGLQYAAQEAVTIFAQRLNGQTIPDQNGDADVKVGHISYSITGTRITSFNTPTTSVTTSPFQWQIGKVGANIHGDWHYHNHGFIHISDHGSFDVSLSGWSLSSTLLIGVDGNGRPTIQSTGCNCGTGSVSVKLHGGASWLYNLFKGKIADALRDQLKKQLCNEVNEVVNTKAAAQLATLQVTVPVDRKLDLDYRLIRSPAFTTTYLESLHKGEIFWTGESQDAPLTPPPISDIVSTSMITIWISEYVVNTLGYVEYKHDALNYNMSKDDLPKGKEGYLNTTCGGMFSICIGTFIHVLQKKFPGATVALGLIVTEAPSISILPSGITGIFKGLVNYYIVYPNKPYNFAFSTNCSVIFNLTAAIVGMNVSLNINEFKIGEVKLVKSTIGNITDQVSNLNPLLNVAVDGLKPKLQELAKRGITLPNVKDVSYVSPKLVLVQNAVVVSTNAKYVG